MAETALARRRRLIAQAAKMRQAPRRGPEDHVCPQGDLDKAYERLMRDLKSVAPDNMAPIPIAMAVEDGEWTVDLIIKNPGEYEYDIIGYGMSLDHAIASAWGNLRRRKISQRQAIEEATFLRLAPTPESA